MKYDEALDLAFFWPEGPAQALALALLELRRRPGDDPFDDPFSRPEEEPAKNPLEELAQKLAAGETSVTEHSGHVALLKEWAQSDPAAACAAVLRAPRGEYSALVAGEVATALAKIDPARALDLVLQVSGEQFDQGVARAWAELSQRTAAEVKDGKNAAWFLQQMSGPQQDSLFRALAEEVGNGRYSEVREPWGAFGDQKSQIELIAEAVLNAEHCGPGMEAFLKELAEHPETAESIRAWALTREATDAGPGYARALEILDAERIANLNPTVDAALLKVFTNPYAVNYPPGNSAQDLLQRAAPRLLPNLMRSGHAEEAVQILGNVQDRTVWRESFEAMLPAWMDADPAAARAAFEKAPLTALERERWERHPAFLLNP